MKPHTVLILILFIIYGVYTTSHLDLNTDNMVGNFLLVQVWINGLYFFYLNFATEDLWGSDLQKTKAKKYFDFWLVIVQGLFFEGLWHFVSEKDLTMYAADILALNITYLGWDIVYRQKVKEKKGKIIFIFDSMGLCLSLLLLLLLFISRLPPAKIDSNPTAHIAIEVASISSVLIYHSFIGLVISYSQFKYIPSIAKIKVD